MAHNEHNLPKIFLFQPLKHANDPFKQFCNTLPAWILEMYSFFHAFMQVIPKLLCNFLFGQTFKTTVIQFHKVIKKNRFNAWVEFYYFFKCFPCPPHWAAVNRINFLMFQFICNCFGLLSSLIIEAWILGS